MTDTTPAAPEDAAVDDVLSSIRKLVSDEAEARVQEIENGFPARNGSALPARSEGGTPLVLTSDLRVIKREEKPEENDPPAVTEADIGEPDAPEGSESLTSGVASDPADGGDLREVVRAVLREELEGEIGERITRNVLKLVRREIARALRIDAKDL